MNKIKSILNQIAGLPSFSPFTVDELLVEVQAELDMQEAEKDRLAGELMMAEERALDAEQRLDEIARITRGLVHHASGYAGTEMRISKDYVTRLHELATGKAVAS